METFEEHPVSAKHKEGNNIALTLHFVQPQEYIEVFRGAKFEPDADTLVTRSEAIALTFSATGQKGVLFKGLADSRLLITIPIIKDLPLSGVISVP